VSASAQQGLLRLCPAAAREAEPRQRAGALALTLTAVAVLAGCSPGTSGTATQAACKAAVQKEIAAEVTAGEQPPYPSPSAPAVLPAACRGLPASVLDRIAAQLIKQDEREG
jgi:hypothetical protein